MVPNEQPILLALLDNVKHVDSVPLWHPLIDEIHAEDVINVSCEARAVGLCVTCCIVVATACSAEDFEALGERLDQDPARYHAVTHATVVLLAPPCCRGLCSYPTLGHFHMWELHG